MVWIVEEGFSYPRSILELDDLAELYCEWIYHYGGAKYRAEQLPDALIFYNPLLKGKLVLCIFARKGLKILSPPASRIPIPPKLAWAIIVVLVRMNKRDSAIAVLLAFDCYLRISEVVNLKCFRVFLVGDSRLGYGAKSSVTMKCTKGGPNQSVNISLKLVERCVGLVREDRVTDEQLFIGMTIAGLREDFYQALEVLQIERGYYVFHGLRAGGAGTDLATERLTFEQIQKRGRWESKKSAKIYVRLCRASLVEGGLPMGNQELVRLLFILDHESVFGLDSNGDRFDGL
jgi:integrase